MKTGRRSLKRKNPVAKFLPKFNKTKVFIDRKKESKKIGYGKESNTE